MDHLTQAIQQKSGLVGISGKLSAPEAALFKSLCEELGLNKNQAASAILRDGVVRLEKKRDELKKAGKLPKGKKGSAPEPEPEEEGEEEEEDEEEDDAVEDEDDENPFG